MDLVHGPGPWGGPWWSMDRVHEVVHGPRSMFCIRPDSVDCTIMPSCMWRVFSSKYHTEYRSMALCVSISVSFCDLGVELYTKDLVKFLRSLSFQDIFFKMALSGLAPTSGDVRSFTALLSGSKDYVCLFTATELRSCIASFETTVNLETCTFLR